ncbi:ATP-binding protein [Thiocystis violascens]|uniref:Putative ATPase n=1 Tax=Thiocystis violascens (strain ATCC 17096 / DSM 198 / 6111) TaxID=765911 RepID=I3Y811_THIV6|nr:AAA family ATPase [Thiocystis violascens]AFL73129.1 putative ATPase [Thiocystis violascens DSM 198]
MQTFDPLASSALSWAPFIATEILPMHHEPRILERLQALPHLYGRDRELASLSRALERLTDEGLRALFVAGYSGVGKTALVNDLQRHLSRRQSLFIRGKFEQFQRYWPFLAPAQALRQLCQWLLAEPEAERARWRDRLLEGLGPDAGALFEILPELAALIGPQPPAPKLGSLETQIRLRALLVTLVRQIATPTHPLVLFLDDLQWADQPSLDLIGALLQDSAINGFLLLGAYRDNAVDTDHPLSRLLRQPTAAGEPPPVLTLTDLTPDDLALLLADLLDMQPDAVRPLAAALHAKTGGNPFFTLEFIQALSRDGALRPAPEPGAWHWDTASIASRPASANVADFLAAGLTELEDATAETLVAVACLGNACTLDRLALATGTAPDALAGQLRPALERGILIAPDANVSLRFCHDRMQQAVHQLRDDAWRDRLHLAMARRFAQAGDAPAHRFSAAEHYAVAADLIVETAERSRVRALFLSAAQQVRQSGSFAAAERFLRLGIDLLSPDAWQSDPDATFALHAELHLVLYSLARHAEADETYRILADHASSPLQLVDPACVQMTHLSNRVLYWEAIELGLALLARLGIAVPLADLDQSLQELRSSFPDIFLAHKGMIASLRTDSAIERQLEAFYRHVTAGALEQLPKRHDQIDERLAGSAKVINAMIPAANSAHPMLAPWLVLRAGRLWIENGYCAATLFPLACIGVTVIGLRSDFATAQRLVQVALAVGTTLENSRETARACFIYANYIGHWLHPIEEDVAHARRAFGELLRAGDLGVASYTFYASQAALLDTGAHLAEIQAENAAALMFASKLGHLHTEQSYLPYRQLIRALEGKTAGHGRFEDADFDEQAHQVAARSNPMALSYFHLYRALAACLFRDEQALVHHAESVVGLCMPIHCHYATALVNLLHSLALIQQVRSTAETEHPALLERIDLNQRWLKARAADAPMNFDHLHALVDAERLDALDQPQAALQAFEQAMRKVSEVRRPWHRALIVERAGDCFRRRGMEDTGRLHLTQAHALYTQWGAHGKARAMRERLPFLDASALDGSNA